MRCAVALIALAATAGGFTTTNRAPRPPKPTLLHGIANFGTFFAESWLGAGACSSRKCPPAKDVFDHVLVDVNQYVHTSARRATSQDDAVKRLYAALDGVLRVARPRKSLVLALDGAEIQASRSRDRRTAGHRGQLPARARRVRGGVLRELRVLGARRESTSLTGSAPAE